MSNLTVRQREVEAQLALADGFLPRRWAEVKLL